MNKKIFDIIVVGGGSAGVAAAWGAAGFGAETLIIERNNCLGGASTMRNVVTYCGLYTLEDRPKLVVGGVADYIVAGLKKRDAITKPQRHRSKDQPPISTAMCGFILRFQHLVDGIVWLILFS